MKTLFFLLSSILFASPVQIDVDIDRKDFFAGEYVKLTVDVNIDKGYFIYSTNPDK